MDLTFKDMFSEAHWEWFSLFLVSTLIGIVSAFSAMCYFRCFETVCVKTCGRTFRDLVIAYKYTTDYRNVLLFRSFQRNHFQYKTIIIQYGSKFALSGVNPAKAYAVGFVLGENGTCASVPEMMSLMDEGYKVVSLKYINYALVAVAFYKFCWEMAYCSSRLYPRLMSYIRARRLCAHPPMEIYDMRKKTVKIVIPLARQDSYYVDEVAKDIVSRVQFDYDGDYNYEYD